MRGNTWREIFYGTLIFQQSSMICIGQHGSQIYFLLISCWTLDSYAQMCFKRYHIIFSTFSLKFKCKICVHKEEIHNFKKTHFGHATSYELTNFKKTGAGLKNRITAILLKIWPTDRFQYWRQNHLIFIFIKAMSHDLLVQMTYSVVALGNAGWYLRLCISYLYWRDTSVKGCKAVSIKWRVHFISLVKEKQKQQVKSENYERWRLFKLR